ncbi:hypothetical protein JCM14036_26220 [Desulfotomaculum defluvii]
MKNKFGYLGFLGFLGFIGLLGFCVDLYYFVFFGFFGLTIYFRYFRVVPDELFQKNVRIAALPTLFVSITVCTLVSGYIILAKNLSVQDLSIGLAIIFLLPMYVFTAIFLKLEKR